MTLDRFFILHYVFHVMMMMMMMIMMQHMRYFSLMKAWFFS